MSARLGRFRELLREKSIDGSIIYKPENRRYLSGFTGSSGYVLITLNDAYFITDFRYMEQAAKQCHGFKVVEHTNQNPLHMILNTFNLNTMAFEDDFVTYAQYKEFSDKLGQTKLVPLEGAMGNLRKIKDDEEISIIEKAAQIADQAFEYILTYMKAGMKENEVALELESFMKKKGASGLSFDSIVASGIRSSLPHGVASDKIIETGDFVTLDFGCIYEGYCSDMTRTIVVGKASEKQKKIYSIVLEAQEKALEAIKPGMTGVEVDKIARDIISENGYGDYFGHGLGHGVGLEVHESPRLSPLGHDTLKPGMIVTDEPGIYLPGFGGVRIEDLVVVTEDGCKTLSKSPKELIEL
ncbi:M24 family metallopeptidase [Anaerosolibacter sp.]|uniref:M24 family metallopeptidase n=1 Tax=Anaerosolibacter sp. TaxID=1872527 RepID=UPI0039EEDC64